MSLLGEDERREAADGLTLEEEQDYLSSEKRPMSPRDKRAIALLIVLCAYPFRFPRGCSITDRHPQTSSKVSRYVAAAGLCPPQ